jgi:iron complex outermembrane receptor protein
VRGFNRPGDYNSGVLVLVDGHRMNENVFESVYIANDFPVDVDLIDRIEVIRGPSSSIYGNNAFFAVINVVTKQGRDLNGFEASGFYGSFDSYKPRLTYGKTFTNGIQCLVSGSFYDSAGNPSLYYPQYNTISNNVNHGVAQNADYERAYEGFGSLSYRDFTLESAYISRLKGVPTGAYGTIFNDNRFNTTDNRAYIDLKYDHTFEHDWELMTRLSYDNYYYYGHYPIIYPNTPVMYQDYAYGNWWTAEAQVTKKLFDLHTLTAGADFYDNFNQDQGNQINNMAGTAYNSHQSSINCGFFEQNEIFIFTNLILSAGARYDYFDTFGSTASPRVGLIYNPWDHTTLKALYGTAFQAPNVYELFYAGPNNEANPKLKPETITTYELVLEQEIGKHLSFIADGFYYQVDDLINQELDPANGLAVWSNLGQVTARGAEFELDSRFAGGLRGRVSYSYQYAEDAATGAELSDSPKHQFKFNLTVPVWRDRVFSGVELLYSSKAKTLENTYCDAFWVANLTLSGKITKNLDVSASVYNLFNATYYFPGRPEHIEDQIQQDGRTFRLKLTYRF